MEATAPLVLLGIGLRKAPSLPAVRVGRVTGLLAGKGGAARLPPSALRLPDPLGFHGMADLRAWIVAREARLATALRVLAGCREVSLELEEDAQRQDGWPGAPEDALAGDAPAGPACAVRRRFMGQRVEAILASEARAAVLPRPGAERTRWSVAVPAEAVRRLRMALELEAVRLRGTGLSLRLDPPGESTALARAVMQDA